MLKHGSLTLTAASCCLLLFGQNAFAANIPNGGLVSGYLSFPQVDSHTFDGVAGQGGVIGVSGDVTVGESFSVLNPDSSLLASSLSDVRIDLMQTGTYTVLVEVNSATNGYGPYQVHLALAPGANEHGAIPNGGSAAETLDDDGELDSFTFDGVADQEGVFSISGNVSSDEYYYIFNPDGTVLRASTSQGRIDLPQTGTYTVVVQGDGNAGTGPFEVHLALAGANEHGAIPNGGSAAEAIDDGGELDSFTFFGANGATGTVSITGSVPGGQYIYVFNPDGTELGGSGSYVNLNLTQDGTYTVVVESFNGAGTGPYTLSLALAGLPVVPLPPWSLVLLALGLAFGYSAFGRGNR